MTLGANMSATSRILVGIMIMVIVSTALLTYTNESLMVLLGVVILVAALLASARLIDKQLEWREALNLFILLLLSASIGSFIGGIVSSTLYSALVAFSILMISLIYLFIAMKVYKH
jgi:uncharacterized membrane protein YfcA